jgi:cysteinyl-tRNA synthetase
MNLKPFDSYFLQFLHSTSPLLNSPYEKGISFKYTDQETALNNLLCEEKTKVAGALANDFDTPTVIKILSTVVKALNKYISQNSDPKRTLVQQYFDFVSKNLSMMGLKYEVSSRATATDVAHRVARRWPTF